MTLNYPAGIASTNVCYAYLQGGQGTVTGTNKTWVTVATAPTASGFYGRIMRRVLDGTEGANESFHIATNTLQQGEMRCYSGVSNSTPEDTVSVGTNPTFAVNTSGSSTTASVTGPTTVTAADELLFFASVPVVNPVSLSTPSGYANAITSFDVTHTQGVGGWDKAQVSAGAVGTVSTTLGAAGNWITAVVALRPGSTATTLTLTPAFATIGVSGLTGSGNALFVQATPVATPTVATTLYTLTGGSPTVQACQTRGYANVNNTTPIDPVFANGEYATGSSNTASVAGISTAQNGEMIVVCAASLHSTDTVVWGTPTALNGGVTFGNAKTAAFTGGSHVCWDGLQAVAANTGAISVSCTATPTGNCLWAMSLVALQPAGAQPTPTPPKITPTPTPTPTSTATPGVITSTNCPNVGILTPTGGQLCDVNGGPITCPTSTNWVNPMNAPYNAVGNGVADDTAAINAANNAGDVCFPSGHTFLMTVPSSGANVTISQTNRHWQAGMIGGAAPILKETGVPTSCSTNDQCVLVRPTSTGGSIIGMDFEGPNHNSTSTYNEWDMGIRAEGAANNWLAAGNYFNGFEGDGEIEIVGSFGGATPCITGWHVAYNSFNWTGNYGYVVVAGQSNAADHNSTLEGADWVENDNATECTGSNTFANELVTSKVGAAWQVTTGRTHYTCLTGGCAAGANYSGNTVSNSTATGSQSCICESASGGSPAVYTSDSCINGCQIR